MEKLNNKGYKIWVPPDLIIPRENDTNIANNVMSTTQQLEDASRH